MAADPAVACSCQRTGSGGSASGILWTEFVHWMPESDVDLILITRGGGSKEDSLGPEQ